MPRLASGALIVALQAGSFGVVASASASTSGSADPQRDGGSSSLSPLLRSSHVSPHGGENSPAGGRLLTGGGSPTTDWSRVSPLLASDPSLAPLLPSVPTAAYAQTLYSASPSPPIEVGSTHTMSASGETVALCSGEVDKPIVAGPSHVCTSSTCSGPGFEVGTEHCRAAINGPSVLLKGKLGTWWARALGSPAWATFTFPAVPPAANDIALRFKIDGRYRPELYGGNACSSGSDSYDCAICTSDPWDHGVPDGVHVLWSAAGREDFVVTGPVESLGASWDSGEYYTELEAPAELNLQPGDHPVVTFLTFSQYGAYGEVSNPAQCSVAHSNQAGYSYKDKMLMLTEASVTYEHVARTDWGSISPLLLDSALSPSVLPSIPSSADALTLYASAPPPAVGDERTVAVSSSTVSLCEGGSSAAVKAIQAGPSHVCTSSTCLGPGYEPGTEHCRAAINGPSVFLRGKLGTWWARALGSPAWATFTFPSVPEAADSFRLSFKIDGRYRPELYGGNACVDGSDAYDCAICTADPWDHRVPPGVHILWSAAGRGDFVVTGPIGDLGASWDSGEYHTEVEAPAQLNLQPGDHPVVTFFTFSQYGAYGEVTNPDHCSVGHSNQGGYAYKDKMLMLTEASFRYDAAVENEPTLPPTDVPSSHPTKEPVAFVPETNTDWASISPLLEGPSLAWALPPVPSVQEAADMYQGFVVGDGAPFGLHTISDFDDADLCGETVAGGGELAGPVRGGPSHVCTADYCSGPGYEPGTAHCGAVRDAPSLQLRSKFGTYWARALGTPAWAQFVFPAVPEGSANFSLRFTMDQRYRPELNGGNPCSGASAGDSYECRLCTFGPWDHGMAPGVHVLWSAAGRDRHVVTGPFDFAANWDGGDLTQTLDPPPELLLQAGEHPTITFMTAFQYPAVGEVPDESRCSVSHSTEGAFAYKDKAFMLEEVSLMYRSNLVLPKEPSVERPRLYGTDAEWTSNFVQPFLDEPCDPEGAPNGGWFGEAGFLDIKSNFDLAARGYKSCSIGEAEGRDLTSWFSTDRYVSDDPAATFPSRTDGYRALHLLRRLWACSDADGGSYSNCEFREEEASQLADGVLAKELQRFADAVWSCGASCGGSGDPAFDLATAEQVSYFAVFYDVMASRPGLLPPQDADAIAGALRGQIELFRNAFWTGQWQLWNGNNWTPHLCVAALEWSIVFWHEDAAMAREVLDIVNDIMWLHRRYYTSDGTYTEGVIMYSIMSIEGQLAMAALQRASFGTTPAAVDVGDLQRVTRFMLSSMSTDAYMIDFGDSHKNRGWSSQLSVVEAALAATLVLGDPASESNTALDATQMRAFAATLYGSGGFYSNPWRIRPGVLQLNSVSSLRALPPHPSRPLGPLKVEVFPVGGYAAVRVPLLDESSPGDSPPCFGSGSQELCIDESLPSLADNIPYSSLALQARPNRFSHSEVDFGQVTWSAWGTRLLSEFSYGTIATSVNEWDMRRYQYLDNNVLGHNTVVIREAFQEGSTEINFSQLSHVDGSLSEVSIGQAECLLLDGSNVYGALRDDGWLDEMRRYSCPLSEIPGSFLLVDVLQVKSNRSPMSLYGSQYGGPNFYESSPPSQRLNIDEFFHTDTSAPFELIDGVPSELPFDRSALSSGNQKWCQHVEVEVQPGNSSVLLQPQCGIGSYRDADGLGLISGISISGQGRFEYDGLITSVDRWFIPHALKKKRFRFVTDDTVGVEGDVRAFLMAPSTSENIHVAPHAQLGKCSQELGCETSATPVQCSCVQACVGESLQWFIVQENELRFVGLVGTCSQSHGSIVDPVLVSAVRADLGVSGTS